ncbi:MAG: acyl-ACP--UDP-N-acetylglucosamine O-acyltransferase [Elusimicrobia bacterium]|nr:acyl-ACP--UDP-N-acetylglucosamine O-acyltransferase [Elusimicrobiota bacterium]MBD3411929.1 acyl-ACP--UDP-N-acetylglucosamine O-acyltransferase [Elusimicrobiota bacterium]
MPTLIHETSIIDPSSSIGNDVEIGPYAVVGTNVSIGDRTKIGPHAVLECVQIGPDCHVYPGASIGCAPQDLKYAGEDTRLIIGARTIIRESVTINRGTQATGETIIGDECLFMAYSHVAHDCRVGNRVILANSVALAGHVMVEDEAVLGGMVGIHQFVRIGRLAMIGAGSMVPLDVPPFTQGAGDRLRLYGINLVGLRRKGFKSESIQHIRKAYRTIYLSKLGLHEALGILKSSNPVPEVSYLIQFIEQSPRGICRAARLGYHARPISEE